MSLIALRASLALWKRRLRFREHRYHTARKLHDYPREKKWTRLVDEARAIIKRREAQIAAKDTTRHTSTRGVNFIKGFEGFVGHPYQDSVGVWTIGYGHTENVGPNTPHLTEPQASRLLAQDLDRKYEPPVRNLGIPLTQGQFDALVSIVYNCGPGIVGPGYTLGRDLRARNYRAAADSFLLYDHAGGQVLPGLLRRRRAERQMFLGG